MSQSPMLLAVISDTHMPRGPRRLPDACVRRLAAADAIVHAGDLSTLGVLEELRAIGPPVTAVHGNVDDAATRAVLPAAATLTAAGHAIAVTHDAGPAHGRARRLQRRFPGAELVIFGHSHIPLHETTPDGFQILNPGSPTERRRASHHTMALVHAQCEPTRLRCELVALD